MKDIEFRQKCYDCFRPMSSCMCKYTQKIQTENRFLILMHPMERQKVKNNTGFLTNHSLNNCEIIEDIDFSQNKKLNSYLNSDEYECYILYPSHDSKTVKEIQTLSNKTKVFILIDATWPCAKKMLRLSKNLQGCPKLSFESFIVSQYQIKKQPKDGFISTIEATQVLLKELNKYGLEKINSEELEAFLLPFTKINEYQVDCKNDPNKPTYPSRKDKRK